jgi:peptide/nickel transport system permease protein
MHTLTLIAKRLAYALGLIFAVLTINFALIHAAPGDPAMVIAGEMGGADQATLDQIRRTYGLDKPILEQYATYVGRALRGDLGQSYLYNQPVTKLIMQRLPATVLLVLTALLTAIVVGTLVGVWASKRPHSIGSGAVTVMSLVGYSMPTFWTGILLVILFGKIIPIMPIAGMRDVRIYGGWWVTSLDVLHHLILPAFTLAIVYMAQYSRLSRASMLEVLGSDYIRTARAKGLAERLVIWKHALRNALIPVVTLIGLQIGFLLGGAVVGAVEGAA